MRAAINAVLISLALITVGPSNALARGGGGGHSGGGHMSAPARMIGANRPQISTRQLSYRAPRLSMRVHLPHASAHSGVAMFKVLPAPAFAPAVPHISLQSLGPIQSVAKSTSVTAKGTITQKETITGTTEKLSVSKSVTSKGTVTTKETVSAVAPKAAKAATSTSTATPKAGKAGKAPKEAKAPTNKIASDKPAKGKAGAAIADGVLIVSASGMANAPQRDPANQSGVIPEITEALKPTGRASQSERQFRALMCQSMPRGDQAACMSH